MTRVSAFLLLAGLALVAMFASLPASGTLSFDCRTISPTGTVTATPTPPAPWEPYARVPVCNDTGEAVSDLHLVLVRPAANVDPIGANAPGCPEPKYFYSGSSSSYSSISIDWGTACVHPGEMVVLYFNAGCTTPEPECSPPHASCYYWTADGAPVPSESPAVNPLRCVDPSPIPTAPPQPTGPCLARGTPPVTHAPTPTPSSPTPTLGPTSRDMVLQTTISYCNDAGESASDLHIHFAFPYSSRTFKVNPSGCPEPSFEPAHYGLDTFDLDVDWGVDCVDTGESLTIEFIYLCGDVPCNTTQPFCYTWTRFGVPVYQGEGDCLIPPTPTPTASPSPTPGNCPPLGTPPVTAVPTPTPWTPRPTPHPTERDVIITSFISFCNGTSLTASDLHVHFALPYSGRKINANPSGCPGPTLSPFESLDTFDLNVDWGVACVAPGESLVVEFTYFCGGTCPYPAPFCYYWSRFGAPISFAPADCPWPTPTPTVTPARLWGDVDCDGVTGSVDALKTLRYVAALGVSQVDPCPNPAAEVRADGLPVRWADVNCDGEIDPGDALALLRHEVGLPVERAEPCFEVDAAVGVNT